MIERVARVATLVAGITLPLLAIHILVDVAFRLSGNSLSGTLDYVTYWWMVLLVSMGVVVAEGRHEHVTVTVLDTLIGRSAQRKQMAVARVITGIFLIGVAWYGGVVAYDKFVVGDYAYASGIPTWPLRFAIPVMALLFLLLLFRKIEITEGDEWAEELAEQEVNPL